MNLSQNADDSKSKRALNCNLCEKGVTRLERWMSNSAKRMYSGLVQ